MLPMTLTQEATHQRLAVELADVEARFCTELLSDLPCVNQLVSHVERYRGKMLRPTLLLVSGLAASSTTRESALSEGHRVIATVVEMVHMATLVHDDVLDDAEVRRHGETVNQLHGNETAVMLGDYLISHAYHLCSQLNQPAVSRLIAEATNTVCEGELLQLANRNNWRLDEPTYFEIIRRKTASFCGVCCQLGAMLNQAPQPIVDGLSEYGEKAGAAFQIVDDLLDLVGAERTVGKTLGRDIQKGKMTLPLIHHLAELSDSRRRELIDLLQAGAVDAVRGQLDEGSAIETARRCAEQLIDQAKEALNVLAPSKARRLLEEMADAVLTRRF